MTDHITIQQFCARFGGTPSRVDAWRKQGFPVERIDGRLMVSVKAAKAWIAENNPVRGRRKT